MQEIYIRGKKEFGDFVRLINSEHINIHGDAKDSLLTLINVWKSKDHQLDDLTIYLENIDEYNDITKFVKCLKHSNIYKCWYNHVEKITSQKINSSDVQYLKLNLANIEFKLKFFENWNGLYNHELEMLNVFRKIEAISLLTKNSTYCLRNLVDKIFINTQELPYKELENYIEVRESEGKGLGVFATDDISENKIITFYPCHGYSSDGSNNYKTFNQTNSDTNFVYEDHCYVVDNQIKIIANPNIINNTLLLGHMINDSVGNTFNLPIDSHSIKNGIYEYIQKSNNNCLIKFNEKYGIIYVISTTHIYKGEELFTSYTPYYWYSRISNDSQLFYDICSEGKMIEFLKNNMFNN